MGVTYQDLLERLYEMSPDQLKMTATVQVRASGEYYEVLSFDTTGTVADVLDASHPYLTIAGS